jgi:hypothetical protein
LHHPQQSSMLTIESWSPCSMLTLESWCHDLPPVLAFELLSPRSMLTLEFLSPHTWIMMSWSSSSAHTWIIISHTRVMISAACALSHDHLHLNHDLWFGVLVESSLFHFWFRWGSTVSNSST